ncbi:hypothetical protein NC651_028180 [Populus alba x Populus x berolinensis]|nr:hypothetical protein NC651_028180 [Populus alba x Populus x berolinensis]
MSPALLKQIIFVNIFLHVATLLTLATLFDYKESRKTADSCISSLSSEKAYRYVVSGDMKASKVGDSCHVDLVVMATPLDNKRSLSYIDIHKILVNGLTLEWDTIYCRECKGQGFCLLDNATHVAYCSNPCNLFHVASFQCA